jgi:hypothetical protein
METLVINGKAHFVAPEVYALVNGLQLELGRLRGDLENAWAEVGSARAMTTGMAP